VLARLLTFPKVIVTSHMGVLTWENAWRDRCNDVGQPDRDQLLMNRGRKRAPNLRAGDRILAHAPVPQNRSSPDLFLPPCQDRQALWTSYLFGISRSIHNLADSRITQTGTTDTFARCQHGSPSIPTRASLIQEVSNPCLDAGRYWHAASFFWLLSQECNYLSTGSGSRAQQW